MSFSSPCHYPNDAKSLDDDGDISDWSDADLCDHLTWETARAYRIPFGKYKHLPLEKMLLSGKRRSYLRWLVKSDELRPETKTNIQLALVHSESVKAEKLKELKSAKSLKSKDTKTK